LSWRSMSRDFSIAHHTQLERKCTPKVLTSPSKGKDTSITKQYRFFCPQVPPPAYHQPGHRSSETMAMFADVYNFLDRPMTPEHMERLQSLTACENLSGKFTATFPAAWTEVQQEQQQRKHPQHLQQTEGTNSQASLIRTWKLQVSFTCLYCPLRLEQTLGFLLIIECACGRLSHNAVKGETAPRAQPPVKYLLLLMQPCLAHLSWLGATVVIL